MISKQPNKKRTLESYHIIKDVKISSLTSQNQYNINILPSPTAVCYICCVFIDEKRDCCKDERQQVSTKLR